MQYLVIFENGRSQSFYIKSIAELYKSVYGGYLVHLMDQQTLDNSEKQIFETVVSK
jgi:hypothetical protein